MSNIYDQLNTKTLSSVSANEISNITDKTHIQAVNAEDLETYNLINEATFRLDGGPIPDSSKLVKATLTDTNQVDLFTPAAGEVYQVLAATSLADTSPGTSITYYLYLKHGIDGTGPPETDFEMYLAAESSASTYVSLGEWFTDIGGNGPFYIDSKSTLIADVSGMGSASRFDVYLLMTRIR